MECLSLKEKPNFDCIFWEDGCTVYKSRPLQCSTFPFWKPILANAGIWRQMAKDCPGMGNGTLYTFAEIETALESRRIHQNITRKRLEED
jgi:Fe-S-cluster containining protein